MRSSRARVDSGHRALHPFGASLRLFKYVPDVFVLRLRCEACKHERLLAFSCKDMNAEKLTEEELAELKKVEEKLGIALVAVR